MDAGAYTKMTENGIPMMRQSTPNALFPRARVHMHRRGFEVVSRSSLSRVESARCRHGLLVEGNSTPGRQKGIRAGIIYPFHTDSLKKPSQRRQMSDSRVTVALRKYEVRGIIYAGRLKIPRCVTPLL